MNPVLVTLYGYDSPSSRVNIGGDRGQSIDLNGAELGFDFAKLFSAIGKGVGAIAHGVGAAKSRKEAAQREAARLAAIAAQKRKMILYVGIGGGVLLLAGSTFLLTRKREKRGNR